MNKVEIIKELEELGYDRNDILDGINEVTERLAWRINSYCSVYSRGKNIWCNGQIINLFFDEITNTEWVIVKYNKTTKKMQRFNDCIKPINSHNVSNHKIIQFISSKLKSNNEQLIQHNDNSSNDRVIYEPNVSIFEGQEHEVNEDIVIKRLFEGLKYFSSLDISNSKHRDLFSVFMQSTYT
eukprot:368290_1